MEAGIRHPGVGRASPQDSEGRVCSSLSLAPGPQGVLGGSMATLSCGFACLPSVGVCFLVEFSLFVKTVVLLD